MSEIAACRKGPEPRWYEWYRFPLKPSLKIKQPDQWNTWSLNFHWLFFRLWTMDSPAIGIGFQLEDSHFEFRIRLPYLITGIFIPIAPLNYKLKFWRRSKGLI